MKIQIDSDFLKPESKFRRSFLKMLDLLYMAQRDSVAKFDLITLDIDWQPSYFHLMNTNVCTIQEWISLLSVVVL